jgi:hypothetical protein
MARQNSPYPERRSAERFLVSLPVETDRGPGMTRDVSVSGLYFVTEQSLAVGDHLELTMSIPDPGRPENPSSLLLVLHARVVRVEEAPGAVTGVGVALDEGSMQLALAS